MHYKNRSTYNTYRKTIRGSIPNCRKWIEEHKTVKQHPFGTFTFASRFLTLAQVWRTFWILKCTKQGAKPARDHLAGNQKRPHLEKFLPGPKHHDKDLYDLMETVLSLSPDFDDRARAMLMELRR